MQTAVNTGTQGGSDRCGEKNNTKSSLTPALPRLQLLVLSLSYHMIRCDDVYHIIFMNCVHLSAFYLSEVSKKTTQFHEIMFTTSHRTVPGRRQKTIHMQCSKHVAGKYFSRGVWCLRVTTRIFRPLSICVYVCVCCHHLSWTLVYTFGK